MIIFVLMLLVSFTLSTPAKSSMTKEKAEKKAIVLAVFGTTYPAALQSIVNLQQKMEDAFPGIPVQVAFTSGFIRAKWGKRANDPKWRRDHPEVPEDIYTAKNTLATLANLQDRGYRHIAVQSTHIYAGEEFENLKTEIETLGAVRTLRKRDKPFKKIFLGRPALGEPGDAHPYTEDVQYAARVLKADVNFARKNKSALVYMGHGNEIFSTGVYVELEAVLRDTYPDVPIFVGNVEGFPRIERVIKGLEHARIKKVTLFPLMVVAGDHAANDMAGSEEDSWKSRLEAAGIDVVPVLRGLGALDVWADIYVDHLKDAMADHSF
ncbi:MAG: sirohydrochlorin cobaltochelatase [Deltaproteobacteria bacterium]|nr:sirohydrochlorin cobaltochelatase [Deltaproteobacteria bacterium]